MRPLQATVFRVGGVVIRKRACPVAEPWVPRRHRDPFLQRLLFEPGLLPAPSPDGPCTRSPRTAGASVPWAHARRTACRRLYTGSALPPPKSSQGRLAVSPRTPTATGAAVGARPESCSVSLTLARRKEASAAPSLLGDVGHVPVPPLASVCPSVYWGHDPKFLFLSLHCEGAHSKTGLDQTLSSPLCGWAGPRCTSDLTCTKNAIGQSLIKRVSRFSLCLSVPILAFQAEPGLLTSLPLSMHLFPHGSPSDCLT